MDIMEKISGLSPEMMHEHDWPSPHSIQDFFWFSRVPSRGSWRLAEGSEGVIDGEEVSRIRSVASRELLEFFDSSR